MPGEKRRKIAVPRCVKRVGLARRDKERQRERERERKGEERAQAEARAG